MSEDNGSGDSAEPKKNTRWWFGFAGVSAMIALTAVAYVAICIKAIRWGFGL
jgi:hypothetical protein